jgi:DNA repair exonuclease SbcCD nuclease subunit
VVPGNHDHGGLCSLWAQSFFARECEKLVPNLPFVLDAKSFMLDGTAVFFVPLLRRHDPTDPTVFDHQDFPADLSRIVLTHRSVQGFDASQEDEYKAVRGLNRIALEGMSSSEIDYIALGDWHGTKQIN